jgi:hypothetical protein
VGSHWETIVFENEYMTASAIKSTSYSQITLSLLRDTGWFASVDFNIADEMFYGKDKGCDFIEKSCYSTT